MLAVNRAAAEDQSPILTDERVAGLFRGLKDGGTKVSLRSNSDAADVAAFSSAHGGGGHVRAAGYPSAEGPAETARAALPGLTQMAAAVSPGR